MMMDNFFKGRNYLTSDLKDGIIENNVKIETKIDYTSAYDQVQFVADAFENITKYDKKEIDLACESLTYTEIGDALEKVFNKKSNMFIHLQKNWLKEKVLFANY